MSNSQNSSGGNADAEFIGWQKNPYGESFALFNITAQNHPIKGSTVTAETLRRMNLTVPGIQGEKGED